MERYFAVNLGRELLELNATVEAQEKEIEMLRLKAAKYKAYFYMKTQLVEKLEKQIRENIDALTGIFDGFCYTSWRANACYRTLEDMLKDELITREEYNFCDSV